MTQEEIPSVKAWKIKLERAAKGYVRVTVHGDSPDDALRDWDHVHLALKQDGEKYETFAVEEEPMQEEEA